MEGQTRRFQSQEPELWTPADDPAYDDEPVQLGDVLEPYDDGYAQNDNIVYDDSGEPMFSDAGYGDEYSDDYADEYGYEYEASDSDKSAGRFKVAMGVFNIVSVLVGILVILLLSALLISLVDWLASDIQHSVMMLQSNLQ